MIHRIIARSDLAKHLADSRIALIDRFGGIACLGAGLLGATAGIVIGAFVEREKLGRIAGRGPTAQRISVPARSMSVRSRHANLLFDIDGTLLMTNGGGGGALKLAIQQEFGLDSACTNVNFSGRTDRSLLAELLERNRLPSDNEDRERLRDRYTTLLPAVLSRRGGTVLPGTVDLLGRLSGESNLRCYVMTGNLQPRQHRNWSISSCSVFFAAFSAVITTRARTPGPADRVGDAG